MLPRFISCFVSSLAVQLAFCSIDPVFQAFPLRANFHFRPSSSAFVHFFLQLNLLLLPFYCVISLPSTPFFLCHRFSFDLLPVSTLHTPLFPHAFELLAAVYHFPNGLPVRTSSTSTLPPSSSVDSDLHNKTTNNKQSSSALRVQASRPSNRPASKYNETKSNAYTVLISSNPASRDFSTLRHHL